MNMIKSLKLNSYTGKVFLSALKEKELELLQESGADEILIPHQMAAANFYHTYLKEFFHQTGS
jgi:hypothetical protein